MIRSLVLALLVLNFISCVKDEAQEVYLDTSFPAIDIQTPVATQLYNKDFPIHITGTVTDNYINNLNIYVVDSVKKDTLYTFTPNVDGKTGYAFNEQYYNPADSGYKKVYVVAVDSADHVSTDSVTYLVY